jgi:hypothetical protein
MNSKIAKYLRSLVGYRNASATPYTREFPGLAKNFLRLPVFESRVVERREWDPKAKAYKMVKVKRMVHGRNEKPRILPPERKLVDGKITLVPHEEMIARTKPLIIKDNSERGRYRMLKRIVRIHGLDTLMATLTDAAQKVIADSEAARAD